MPAQLPETIAEMTRLGHAQFGDRPALRYQRDGSWRELSYAELDEIVTEIGLGLMASGIEAGDRVGVLADTRAEWAQAQYGIATAGAVLVPIYPSSSAEECHWVLGDSGAVAVICENAEQVAKITQVRDQLPQLRLVVVMEPGDAPAADLDLGGLRALGRGSDRSALDERIDAVRADEPAVIIYTSGTTGRPKGCVLTHRNNTFGCEATSALGMVGSEDICYLFLPLAHCFAQIMQMSMLGLGGVVAYCSAGGKAILADCAQLRPTVLPSVPRIFEKIYAQFAGQVPAAALREAIDAALAVRRLEQAGGDVPEELRRAADEADARLLSKARAALGGRIRVAISGAAPISPEILEFFHAAGVPVYEGYGMSESMAMGTLNSPTHVRLGSIGRALPECDVRIADDGEILMRGPHIFAGYWGNPEATAEVLVDGWLHSGDLGTIDDAGFVTITGRKKDIIITAGGKNLTPANIENDLRQVRWISQAVMYGDRRPYPVALVTLDIEEIGPWAEQQGLPAELACLARNQTVLEMIRTAVDAANAKYAKAAQIKRFAVLEHDFSIESGELTPTQKIKRAVIAEKYAEVFERLYAR